MTPLRASDTFTAYMMGFSAYAGRVCAFPAGTTDDQILSAVSNYVNGHPARWSEPEDLIAFAALNERWPADPTRKPCVRRAK